MKAPDFYQNRREKRKLRHDEELKEKRALSGSMEEDEENDQEEICNFSK